MLINALVLALSFFNTICLLWLGLMVLLVGNRRSPGVWLTGSGLLLGAIFFTSHTAILGRGLGNMSLGMNLWWWISWTPAVAAPLAWYGALLWYAGVGLRRYHAHHLGLAATLGLALLLGGLLVFANPLPSYDYVAGRSLALTPGIAGIPYLVLAYLLYSLLCYLLPLDLLNRGFENFNPRLARAHRRARPWLSGASLALLLAGGVLAWAAMWALTTRPLPGMSDAAARLAVQRFDVAIQALVGLAVTLLGRAIVGYEVFTGRAMPRGRFFRHWRSTVLLAGGFGAAAAFSLVIELRPIYSLMLVTALMVVFYALYSWRTFVEREDFMARLRPFVASQDLYGHMTRSSARLAQETGNSAAQFQALCADLLEVRAALLMPAGPLATLAGPGLVYPPDAPRLPDRQLADLATLLAGALGQQLEAAGQVSCLPDAIYLHLPDEYEWIVPLWSAAYVPDMAQGTAHGAAQGAAQEGAQKAGRTRAGRNGERRLSGILLLAEKTVRAPLTEEEMQIAQAAGERLVDSLAAAEMARLALDLLRQRLAQTRVLEGQGRRVLHDEVLPELHAAILYLSGQASEPAAGDPGPAQSAIQQISAVHRRISDLMRELPLATPHRLVSGGLASALPALLEGPLGNEFQRITWNIELAAADAAQHLALFSAEVLFFAARELVRNAARHGRGAGTTGGAGSTGAAAIVGGGQQARVLNLWISLVLHAGQLELCVEDDGVGLQGGWPPGSSTGGSGSGLRMHTALLAAIGAMLELSPRPGGGLRAQIKIDAEVV